MTRRQFFSWLGLGTAALPGILRTVATPPAALTALSGTYFNQTLVLGQGAVIAAERTTIIGCRLIGPWWLRHGEAVLRIPATIRQYAVHYNLIMQARPPFWARVLRLQ